MRRPEARSGVETLPPLKDASPRPRNTSSLHSGSCGFTLLELILVIALLGTILLLVFPRIPSVTDYTLTTTAKRLSSVLRYLEESATTKKVYYRVWFSPESDDFRVESSSDGGEFIPIEDKSFSGFTFPKGIDLVDITIMGLGTIRDGEGGIVFNPLYGADPFKVHLGEDEKRLTVTYNPYSGRIKVKDGTI